MTKFLGKVGHGPGTNEFNYGDDPNHRPDPGVRSGSRSGIPDPGRTGIRRRSVLSEYTSSFISYCKSVDNMGFIVTGHGPHGDQITGMMIWDSIFHYVP